MASEAQRRATKKFEDKAYFKTLVRFKKEDEERIRAAAGDSLNGYIVKCVLDALEDDESSAEEISNLKSIETAQEAPETAKTESADDFIVTPKNANFGINNESKASTDLAELQALIEAKKLKEERRAKEMEQDKMEGEERRRVEEKEYIRQVVERIRSGELPKEDAEKEQLRQDSTARANINF